MNKYLSRKIRHLSFLSVLLVLFIHAYHLHPGSAVDGVNFFIQNFISQGLGRIGVPFFFLFSGYLFFKDLAPTAAAFVLKYRKRLRTLLIPYLFWSGWGLGLLLLLQSLPLFRPFLKADDLAQQSWMYLADRLLFDPVLYQLWFLRDLLLLVLFSPLIYVLIRYLKIWILLILAVVWALNQQLLVAGQAAFFFTLGAWFQLQKPDVLFRPLPARLGGLLSLCWFVLLLVQTALMWEHMDIPVQLLNGLHAVVVAIGMGAVWFLYDAVVRDHVDEQGLVHKISGYTFFIFVAHEPILTLIRKALFLVCGHSAATSLVIYFAAPTATLALVYLLGIVLKNLLPRFYLIITGGR